MLKRRTTQITLGSALIACGIVFSDVQADLSTEILRSLNDPNDNTREIRPEIAGISARLVVPEPSNLADFIQDKQRAIELGKALFWDMQVGSDRVQACASCHFAAGADNRIKNQLSPGLKRAHQDASPNPDTIFDPSKGVNYTLKATDFPLHQKQDPLFFFSPVTRDTNDVVSSQGVHHAEQDTTAHVPDPDGFQVNGINTRRVEPRHTPTVINAIFNHRNLWDGAASNTFNGANPFGANDPFAFVYKRTAQSVLESTRVSIDNASMASQALGPPVSSFEMSADGRTWTIIGDQFITNASELPRRKARRILRQRPLRRQRVHPEDSVLGYLARRRLPGLTVANYDSMIRAAFRPEWWDSLDYSVRINTDGSRDIVNAPPDENTYSQMEMNFSLFFGLAIQLYEATLISDQSRVDQFLEGDKTALTDSELVGFHIADDEGRCFNCHDQREFTRAATSRIEKQGLTRIRGGDLIDEGFNNIGVRPTLEDLGVGGIDPTGSPLSFARRLQLDPNAGTAEENNANLAADGAFKIPTLRNVELTAPYFHNGGVATLEDVVDFYFRGGDFRRFEDNPDPSDHPHPIIGYDAQRVNESEISGLGILRGEGFVNSGPGLDEADKANIVAFLKALTDERVRFRRAPFDHPQLFVPNGHPGDHTSVIDNGIGNATDSFIEIPAVGRNGGPPLPSFQENLDAAGVSTTGQ